MSRIIYGDAGSECFLESDDNEKVNNFIEEIYGKSKYAMFYKPIDKSLVVGIVDKYNSRGGGFVSAESIDRKDFFERISDVGFLSVEQFDQYRVKKPTCGDFRVVDNVDLKVSLNTEQLEYLIALMFQVDGFKSVSNDKESRSFYIPGILKLGVSDKYSFNLIQLILKYIPKTVRERFSYFCGTFNHVTPSFINDNFDFCITNDTELFKSYNIYTIDDLNDGLKLPNSHNVRITPYIKYLAGVIKGEREPMPELEQLFDKEPIGYEYKGQFKAYDKLATILLETEYLYKQGASEDAFSKVDDMIYELQDSGLLVKSFTDDTFDRLDEVICYRVNNERTSMVDQSKENNDESSKIYKMKLDRLEQLKTQIALLQKEQAELTMEIEQLSNQQQLGGANGNTK